MKWLGEIAVQAGHGNHKAEPIRIRQNRDVYRIEHVFARPVGHAAVPYIVGHHHSLVYARDNILSGVFHIGVQAQIHLVHAEFRRQIWNQILIQVLKRHFIVVRRQQDFFQGRPGRDLKTDDLIDPGGHHFRTACRNSPNKHIRKHVIRPVHADIPVVFGCHAEIRMAQMRRYDVLLS